LASILDGWDGANSVSVSPSSGSKDGSAKGRKGTSGEADGEFDDALDALYGDYGGGSGSYDGGGNGSANQLVDSDDDIRGGGLDDDEMFEFGSFEDILKEMKESEGKG
jgi:hypothetical protein